MLLACSHFYRDGTPDNDVLLYYNIADVMSEQGDRSLQHFSGLDRNMLESSVREKCGNFNREWLCVGYDFLTSNFLKIILRKK